MSRSFRKSYLGYPFHSPRGWYWGKNRQLAKKTRYLAASLEDEDGTPLVVRCFGGKWNKNGGGIWHEPDKDKELHVRNGRWHMRLRRRDEPAGIPVAIP